MNLEERTIANGLWGAVVSIDLQLYKGSIYKLRWGSPGGLDHAIPSYQEARRTLDHTQWPSELEDSAVQLSQSIDTYISTLQAQDVTSASAQHSRMMSMFESLRDRVRVWPHGSNAERDPSADSSEDPRMPGHQEIYEGGM